MDVTGEAAPPAAARSRGRRRRGAAETTGMDTKALGVEHRPMTLARAVRTDGRSRDREGW